MNILIVKMVRTLDCYLVLIVRGRFNSMLVSLEEYAFPFMYK